MSGTLLLSTGSRLVLPPAGARLRPQTWWCSSSYTARLTLIVDNPDAVFEQAVAAGAVVRSPMQDHEYGWRDGSILDPFGHRWEIGKPL